VRKIIGQCREIPTDFRRINARIQLEHWGHLVAALLTKAPNWP
jgi:hypothetical protein